MDKSFGYNRMSRPEDFLAARSCSARSPTSRQGRQPAAQRRARAARTRRSPTQLERLAGWRVDAADGEALYGTRPWRRAEGTTAEGPVRFTGARRGTSSRDVLADGVRHGSPCRASPFSRRHARSTPAPELRLGPPTAEPVSVGYARRRGDRPGHPRCTRVTARRPLAEIGACAATSARRLLSSVAEDEPGLGLGVEEGRLRRHALAAVGGRRDLGDGGRAQQDAGLGLAGRDRACARGRRRAGT